MSDSRPVTPALRPQTPSNARSTPKTSPPQPVNGTNSVPKSPFALDVEKLHSLPSEQQELYLLTFTADLASHVDSLDADGATREQVGLKGTLFQVINIAQPPPSRLIRHNLGRCFVGLLTKGSRKILYESINELVAILNTPVKEKDLRCKHAAVSCLGAVFEAAGDSATSLSPLACTAAIKLIKTAASDTGCQAAVYRAMGRILNGIKVAIDEDIARMIWKQARSPAGSDRALLVQQQACWCLEQLVRTTSYFDNSNDFEKLQSALLKALDSACVPVRSSAASCLATVLIKNFSESETVAVARIRKPKKAKKTAKGPEELDDDIERTSSPVPEKPALALVFTLGEILKILSAHYTRSTTSNKVRAGLAVTYLKIFKGLGESIVETRYNEIAKHLFVDILSYPGFVHSKYKQLISRKFVRVILERVVGKVLGESAQLNACRFLINDILKDYPQAVKERAEPSKQTLTGALSALTALMRDLDAAVAVIADPIRETLLQVLQHPSFTVQIHTARALRVFVLAVPQQILPTVSICMNSVSRELSQISGPRQSPRRCLGYAYGLAAVLSTSSQRPLYGSVDVYARVLQQATSLLKGAGSKDLRISCCQIQVAWVMIGGLMSLGPNFVKIHLPQLMLLWKNALPRPLPKENIAQRNMLELSFLAHVRECALGSIRAFLTFNQRLLTLDVSRRLAGMLENTATFLQSLPDKKTSEDPSNRIMATLQLQDYEIMVRRRVFQCFCQLLTLSPSGSLEATAQSTILPMAVATFSDAEYYVPNSSLSASIASAAGTFDTIWDVGDNFGFGVNGLVRGLDFKRPLEGNVERHWSTRQDDEDVISQAILSPIGAAAECDALSCYLDQMDDIESVPNPASTAVVNVAISAFGLCLPLQTSKVQEGTLEQIGSSLSSSALQKDVSRKTAIMSNVSLALLTACKVASGELGSSRGDMRHQAIDRALQSLLHICLHEADESVRQFAASALGRLCTNSGNAFTVAEVTYLTETIVKNREPHVRAGCALALASIHAQLGGMAAGLHMKSIVGILMSLAADTHPLVHMWALDALARVAESAGLNFSGYVTSCLGMLGQLYVADTHNVETANIASSNMAMSLPVTAAIVRGVDAVINVVGPDLQDMTKAREMITSLVRLFSTEQDIKVLLESLRCMDHLSLYAPEHVEFQMYVRRLQHGIDTESAEVRQWSLHGLYTVMRRDADEIVRIAESGLEERLWDYLNSQPDQASIRSIFLNWLQQTGPSDPAGWIQRFNVILTRTKSKDVQSKKAVPAEKDTSGPDLQDEEVAGFAVSEGASKEEEQTAPSSTQELMRWQVRLFAMESLHSLIAMIKKDAAIRDDSAGEVALQHKVAEVIRIAFSASTSGVTALRAVGLRIVDQILEMFGHTPDPDFPEAMLLEQYQAQISSALTPAFSGDSSPELASEAVNVCATFIATGIVTDIDRMGRILRLLVSALDSFSKDSETASIGDLKALSSNAQVMVRMAVFSAWAELQIASVEQKYLVDVVSPHIAQLVPLWMASLREYSRLRFEPDISATSTASLSGDLDTVYAALNRQTLLGFYQDSWLSLVDAIASLIDEDSEFVFDALDGKHAESMTEGEDGNKANGTLRKGSGINYREEPVAFFFVLFGLAFESLAVRSKDDDVITKQRNLDILQALNKILRPSVSGNAVYQEVVFAETMDLLDRMVLTESLSVQTIIVDIARNLCMSHPSSRIGLFTPSNGEALSDDIEQLFELTRIIVLVLAGLIPGLVDSPVFVRLETSDEAVLLVRTALQALVDVADVFPNIIKTDLHATILHIFITILGTAACQAAVVPQALSIFRRFVTSIINEEREETTSQLRNTLCRMQMILRNAQKRETDASLPCEKNTMLAITILLTAAPQELPDSDELVTHFIGELCDALEAPATSRVAAGCIRTLLLSNTAAATLLSHSISFLLTPSDLDGIDDSKTLVAQTLTMYAAKLPPQPRAMATAVIMRTLLARAAQEPKTHQEMAARLLELANADNATFRAVVGGMDDEQKQSLEKVLKARGGVHRTTSDFGGGRGPSIALKMEF